jgi:hypothetical protein
MSLEQCPHCGSNVLYLSAFCPNCQKSKTDGSLQADFAEAAAAPPYRLYSQGSLIIASFLGSCFAGAFLFSHNFRVRGEESLARNALVLGAFGLVAVILLFMLLDQIFRDHEGFNQLMFIFGPFLQAVVVHLTTERLQQRMSSDHKGRGGHFYSLWRGAAVGLVFGVCIFVLWYVVVTAFFLQRLRSL